MSDFSINPLVLIGVGSSFAFSGLFYRLYKEKREEIQKLKEIPAFRPDQHLVRILKASPHKRLQYVAIEGLVQAESEPLASQFIPRCFGVIQRIAVQDHWKVWNYLTSTWNSKQMNKKETNNTVAFGLVCPGAYINDCYVKVQAPLEASGCYLERVYHRIRHAEEGLVDIVVQGLSGEKLVAQEETEELLRVGSTLTGFGELVLEGGQVMRLQAPQGAHKYILVPTDYKSFMKRHESSATMWMVLTALSGITGASLLTGTLYGALGGKDSE